MSKNLNLIVAIDDNYLIGDGDKLPWFISEELQHFKKLTENNIVVMGRKTFESIGKPLVNRINVVLTSKEIDSDIITVSTIKELHQKIRFYQDKFSKKIFVIGGLSVYIEFLPFVDEIHISKIKGEYKGDIYFKELKNFDFSKFKLIKATEFENFIYYHYKKEVE